MKKPLLLLLVSCSVASADDFAALCSDRAAIERVYYTHRLGDKSPFEQLLPPATLEQLVRQDLRKETTLKKVYGLDITTAMLDAEVQRMTTTTRAPEMLAELKSALGNDPARFARTMAEPILVERLLREQFDNDDKLHAPQRGQVEQARSELLAAKQAGADSGKLLALLKRCDSNAVTETTWQLAARPVEARTPSVDEIEIKRRFGEDAQILSSPHAHGKQQKSYFEDLPDELQRVLRIQLRQPGDVSALIETPTGFLLYVAKARTSDTLSVAGLALPKCRYDEWLDQQNRGPK